MIYVEICSDVGPLCCSLWF